MKDRIIVFAPHPGDEVWGCGGTIAKKISEGYEALMVVMTDGRYAFLKMLGIDSDPSPDELGEMRKEDSMRGAKVLGVDKENLIFWDFEDGTLKKNESKVQEKVIKILSETSPVELYFSYKNDLHLDHRATSRIIRNSAKELGLCAMKYQYSIMHKYTRIGPIVDGLLDLFNRRIIRVDISEYLPLKEAAIKELKSETTIISSRQERPLEGNIGKFLKDKETFFVDK